MNNQAHHSQSPRGLRGFMVSLLRSLIPLSTLLLLSTAVLGEETYREPFRPQFHFTPQRNWMNDPNGMVYFDGEWHLFYQYNPEGDRWGHMSWGHAVSRDLIHWEHLPLALPEGKDEMIFSGSAVVDWKNTSGFGTGDMPPLVAIYTGHRPGRQDQRLAYSNDRGRTWTKYSANPVLDVKMADFRDPKVFWHEPSSRWVMTVALATEQKVHFYASPDLKQWQYVGEFGSAGATDGLWECPDLFQLDAAGGGSKSVLIVNVNPGGPAGGSGCQYFVGEFDGRRFVRDPLPESAAEFVPEGKVLGDFEEAYGDWKPEGGAFGDKPAQGTLPRQQAVSGFKGKGLVNSYRDGDGPKGTLTSPAFEITAGYISFLIGGGAHEETRVDLMVDGKAVRTATGHESERLAWHVWDVRDLKGKQAEIKVVDDHSGSWGHINLDHVILADQPAKAASDGTLWADFGADFYAAVSWSDVPKSDGRRLWLGWMSNWEYANDVPTSPWRSAMSIPRELRLLKTEEGYRLAQTPVRELKDLRHDKQHFAGGAIAEANQWIEKHAIESGPLELILTMDRPSSGTAGLKLFHDDKQETLVGVDWEAKQVFIDRSKSGNVGFNPRFVKKQQAPIAGSSDTMTLHIFVDVSSVEVFVDDGQSVLTSTIFPSPAGKGLQVFGTGAEMKIRSLEAWRLNSIWK